MTSAHSRHTISHLAALATLGVACSLSAAENEPPPPPTAANAPQSIDAIPCAYDVKPPDFGLLQPRNDWQPPAPQSLSPVLEKLRMSLLVDPAGICRYRAENLAVGGSKRPQVIFMGDSITEGWKAAAPTLFSGSVLDRGISGQSTIQMLLRFREDVINLRPSVVHILAGVNDINTPAGAALTKSNLSSMVELARAHRITVILGSLTPCSHFVFSPDVQPVSPIAHLNAWLEEYAKRNHVIYVDYFTPLKDAGSGFRSDLSNDALHPNQLGYDLMTPLARHAIARALKGARAG